MTAVLEVLFPLLSVQLYIHVRTSGDTNHPWMIYNFLELEMTAIHRLVSSRHTKTRPLCKITGKPPIAIPQRGNFAPIRHAAHNTRGRPKTFFVFVECESTSKKDNSQVSTSVWHQLLFLDCQLGISCRSAWYGKRSYRRQ